MLYQLNEQVDQLKLRHGELLLINHDTGHWVKTSMSFMPILKLLKKGIGKSELENFIDAKYKDKKEELMGVVDLIKDNGLFKSYNFKGEVFDLKKSNFVNIITFHPVNLELKEFLSKNFLDKKICLIVENSIENLEGSLEELKEAKNELNMSVSIRMTLESLNEGVIKIVSSSPVEEIQLLLNEFYIERVKEKLKLIEILKDNKRVNLRINLFSYSLFRKKESIVLPVDVIDPHSYTLTFEDIINSNRVYNKIKKFFKLWEEFHTEIRIPKKPKIKPQIENLFTFSVIFPIKRTSCGAGLTNLFIDRTGAIYPCKYWKDFQIGSINEKLENLVGNEKVFKCDGCHFQNLCGGIGKCIQNSDFERVCRYMQKLFRKFIESFSIDLLKKLNEFSSSEGNKISEKEVLETKIKLIKRFTCLPGVF